MRDSLKDEQQRRRDGDHVQDDDIAAPRRYSSQQPSRQSTATGGRAGTAQHPSPRQVPIPSLTAMPLSVLGAESGRLFVDGADLLRSWLPKVEDLTVEGAGHLVQIQRPEPVARGIAEFLGRYPIALD